MLSLLSQAAEAQFGALEHPSTPGFAQRYGIPEENVKNLNFIEAGTLKPGTPLSLDPLRISAKTLAAALKWSFSVEACGWSGSALGKLMTLDYYAEAKRVAATLEKEGFADWAAKISSSIEDGVTATEILMMLRWNLGLFLEAHVGSDSAIGSATELFHQVDTALS